MNNYPLLSLINSPEDLRLLNKDQLPQLCQELRSYLLESVSQTSGHLASGLGTVELTVAETQPSIKGATVTGSGKPATMETGLVVNVPDFIEAGQKLVINTTEGTYVSRA